MSTRGATTVQFSMLTSQHDNNETNDEKQYDELKTSSDGSFDVVEETKMRADSNDTKEKHTSTSSVGLQTSITDGQCVLDAPFEIPLDTPSEQESSLRKPSSPFDADRKHSHDGCNINDSCINKNHSTSSDSNRKCSFVDSSVGSVTCRICLEGDAIGDPLINPCLCTGSASHVHITCLKKWLMTSGSTVCELCLYELDVGWKATSLLKALKNISRARLTNRKICWALLVSIAALTLPLFCICIFVLDDENLRLQMSRPASMALSYGVILISCTAYLALLFMVAYLTWKWNFCPNTARCHFPTEIEIRVESLEERIKRGRARRGRYYRNATPILSGTDAGADYPLDTRVADRTTEMMDSYWMTGGAYV
ncbi:uncharacterized protein [Diadema antillarum]|uniref:uncharacterized protein n=1 Tax=Diadema antillarum TaxID=105358 RepID=UPI003A8C80EE